MRTEAGTIVPGTCHVAGRWRTPAYPVATFVDAAMTERGVTRGALAAALGYRNNATSLRHLDRLVDGDEVPPEFHRRFMTGLGIDRRELNAAVGEIARAHDAHRNGCADPFGAIKAYLFRTEFEKAIWLDTEGVVPRDDLGEVPDVRAYSRCEIDPDDCRV